MIIRMKTTVILNDQTMGRVKALAAERRKTLSETIEALLRRGLEVEKSLRQRNSTEALPSFDVEECYVDVSDRNALYRVMEGR
jgi:hypothetical protein